MRLNEVHDRVREIGESLGDGEVAFSRLRVLYWDVLVAIANGQCEDAPPKDFAAAASRAELLISEAVGFSPDHLFELQQRLDGCRTRAAAEGSTALGESKERSPKKGAGTKKGRRARR
jgi:hypothetical protein